MTNARVDVLVVGAGPTGLTLAAQLVVHGVRPRIIDRGLDRVHESRALAIQPRSLEVLAGLGVTDRLVAAGNRNTELRLHARGRVASVPLFDLGPADTAYPYLLFLSQAETERILGDCLTGKGVSVERGVELVALDQDGEAATATLRHPDGREELVHASYVVGCDGAHSTVRTLAGIGFEGGTYPQTFLLADLEADGVEPGAAHVYLSLLDWSRSSSDRRPPAGTPSAPCLSSQSATAAALCRSMGPARHVTGLGPATGCPTAP